MTNIELLTVGIEDEYAKAKELRRNLNDVLEGISKHFNQYKEKCESISKGLLEKIASSGLKECHSISRRIKDADSLLKKVIRKIASTRLLEEGCPSSKKKDIEKYKSLDENNYYKIITDLIGIRILIRYRQEWVFIDEWIRSNFIQNYLTDWEREYDPNPRENYIVEKPKIYYKYADRDLYESIDPEQFDLYESKEGYNSYHYIINYQGCYVELQVRTILDEAWCECTHDIIYKGNPNKTLKLLAKSMTEQVKAAEVITQIIYESINDVEEKKKATKSDRQLLFEETNRFDEKLNKLIEKRLGE